MENKTYKDDNPAFDYVAGVLYPTIYGMNREQFAKYCIEAAFEQDMQKFHAKGANILEQMAIRLMGTDWCRKYLEEYVFVEN